MRYRWTVGTVIANLFIYLTLCIVIVVMVYPFLNVLAISLSHARPVLAGKVTIIPQEPTLLSYQAILSDPKMYVGFLNTVFYAAAATLFRLVVTSMIAYALSCQAFFLRKQITFFLVVTMFISGGLIPTYFIIRAVGLINSRLVYIIPGAVAAWNVVIYRTFFQTLPGELRESARMDGAGDFLILFRVIVPLSKPLLATMAIFSILGVWNDYFTAFIYLKDTAKYPIQMLLMSLLAFWTPRNQEEQMRWLQTEMTSETVKAAAVMVVALPILMVYPFFQKYFAKGVLVGSLKG